MNKIYALIIISECSFILPAIGEYTLHDLNGSVFHSEFQEQPYKYERSLGRIIDFLRSKMAGSTTTEIFDLYPSEIKIFNENPVLDEANSNESSFVGKNSLLKSPQDDEKFSFHSSKFVEIPRKTPKGIQSFGQFIDFVRTKGHANSLNLFTPLSYHYQVNPALLTQIDSQSNFFKYVGIGSSFPGNVLLKRFPSVAPLSSFAVQHRLPHHDPNMIFLDFLLRNPALLLNQQAGINALRRPPVPAVFPSVSGRTQKSPFNFPFVSISGLPITPEWLRFLLTNPEMQRYLSVFSAGPHINIFSPLQSSKFGSTERDLLIDEPLLSEATEKYTNTSNILNNDIPLFSQETDTNKGVVQNSSNDSNQDTKPLNRVTFSFGSLSPFLSYVLKRELGNGPILKN